MKKGRKPARGQKIIEGTQVRSLRPEDDGTTGTVVKASHKKNGWIFSVMFEGWYQVAERREDELEALV